MTIKLGSYQIVLFKITKLERFEVKIDKNESAKQAEGIKSTAEFTKLKEKAKAIRALRS